MFFLLTFLVHQWSVALFRMMGALCRNLVVANAVGMMVMLLVFLVRLLRILLFIFPLSPETCDLNSGQKSAGPCQILGPELGAISDLFLSSLEGAGKA